MTAEQLIKRLQSFNPDTEVMILDSFNGGGSPREINLGPTLRVVSEEDTENSADCEELIDKVVVVIGFGCY